MSMDISTPLGLPPNENRVTVAPVSVAAMAQAQGVSPVISPESLRADFWPDEDSVDEFLAFVRATRREESR